jgi:hypothetical protein
MRLIKKYFLLAIITVVPFGLSGCLEEKEGLYDVVGPVATIPVFTASRTTPTAGETINLSIRYYSPNVAVKELRLNETLGTAQKRSVTSKVVNEFNTQNSYVDTFSYTVPAGTPRNTRIVLEMEAVTANDLVGNRTLTLTVSQ